MESAADTTSAHADGYRCPGERYPISRAVHLGRLAAFYPACRRCERRREHGPLSPRQVKRLAALEQRRRPRTLFREGGIWGVLHNDVEPPDAFRLAVAFGLLLQDAETVRRAEDSAPGRQGTARSRQILLAHDGRPETCELVAAAGEGLRWAGWPLVDLGAASAPCAAFAAGRLGASGAMLVGNPAGRPETVGFRFWRGPGEPLDRAGLAEIARRFGIRADRPTRKAGSARRLSVEAEYLARFAGAYHGLRPLRLVFHSTCPPLARYLARLLEATACQPLPSPALPRQVAGEVVRAGAHFGAAVSGDGESLDVWDEAGRHVPAERFARLGGEDDAPGPLDALQALTRLLGVLSRSDRPLSAVLDTGSAAA